MKSIVMSVLALSAVAVLTFTLLFLRTLSAEAEAADVGISIGCIMFAGDGTLIELGDAGQNVDTNNGRIFNDDGQLTCAARQPEEIPLNDTAVMFNFEKHRGSLQHRIGPYDKVAPGCLRERSCSAHV